MRRKNAVILISAAFITLSAVLLNIEVTTRQGIDYRQRTVRLPLYLKVLDFCDRHFNYRNLAAGIVRGARSESDRVLAIFKWTDAHIRMPPAGMPVIDDHVWNIIIRGYGEEDQIADAFCVLCNYAGLPASMRPVYSRRDRKEYIIAAFVFVNGAWCVFDPYRGVYFENQAGEIASADDLGSGKWKPVIVSNSRPAMPDYREFFWDIAVPDRKSLNRQTVQSPWKRLLYQLKFR